MILSCPQPDLTPFLLQGRFLRIAGRRIPGRDQLQAHAEEAVRITDGLSIGGVECG